MAYKTASHIVTAYIYTDESDVLNRSPLCETEKTDIVFGWPVDRKPRDCFGISIDSSLKS